MGEYLGQLNDIAGAANGDVFGDVPIICSGDIFHKWDSPPELINFAISNLPKMYAIPGQHDLPNHSYDDIRRSAYWTLVEAEIIHHIENNKTVSLVEQGRADVRFNLNMTGFSWGSDLHPFHPIRNATTPAADKVVNVAVVHKYTWVEGKNPAKVQGKDHASALTKCLGGFDVVLIGDNHRGFCTVHPDGEDHDMTIFNNGTFLRRKSDEMGYAPWVGILLDDGTVQPKILKVARDKFLDVPDEEDVQTVGLDAQKLLKVLNKLASATHEFADIVEEYLNSREGLALPMGVRQEIQTSLRKAIHAKS